MPSPSQFYHSSQDKFTLGWNPFIISFPPASQDILYHPAHYFSGKLEEIRIWNGSLDASTINFYRNYVLTVNNILNNNNTNFYGSLAPILPNNLVAYYPLDEGIGNRAWDKNSIIKGGNDNIGWSLLFGETENDYASRPSWESSTCPLSGFAATTEGTNFALKLQGADIEGVNNSYILIFIFLFF